MGSVTISTSGCKCCCAGSTLSSSVAFVSSLTKGCSCGFAEYIPSTPFKIYRTRTMGGGERTLTCGGDLVSSCTLSGACSYDASTCAFTDSTSLFCTGGSPSAFCNDLLSLPDCSRTGTKTPTSFTLASTGVCCAGDGTDKLDPCNFSATLSDEDTPTDVLNRGTVTAGTDGCAWGLIVDYTGVGCPAGQYGASKQSCDWTISFTGLVIGCQYTVVITFTSTPGGTSTETHLFTADMTTDTLTGTITQTDGVVKCLTGYTVKAGDP